MNPRPAMLNVAGALLALLILLPGRAAAQPPAADIWYLGHCGYAVSTPNHLLIFDYIELEETVPARRGLDLGFIDPAQLADRKVTVFVTHDHVDHYDRVIDGWAGTIPDLRYVFGWPAPAGPGRTCVSKPLQTLRLDDLVIHTVPSAHAGVPEAAFLVQVDGLTLFFEGDYQGRLTRGGTCLAAEHMAYLRQFVDRVDLLFVGAWAGEPVLEIIRGLPHAVLLPMHYRKRESEYRRFAAELKELGIDSHVVLPQRRGDLFRFREGKILGQEQGAAKDDG